MLLTWVYCWLDSSVSVQIRGSIFTVHGRPEACNFSIGPVSSLLDKFGSLVFFNFSLPLDMSNYLAQVFTGLLTSVLVNISSCKHFYLVACFPKLNPENCIFVQNFGKC